MGRSNSEQHLAEWRTPIAIGLAGALGTPLGVFLGAAAVPFGPVLAGWLAVLVGAIAVPGALCFLATRGYLLVRLSYAAGTAAGAVGVSLFDASGAKDLWRLPLQFAMVFLIVSLVSHSAAGLWALLSWADRRVLEWEDRAIDSYAQAAAVHGAEMDRGDHKKSNAAFDRKMRALAKLRESPDQGRSSLTELLEHEDPHVRCSAATHLLPLDEEAATRALEALTSEPPFVSFNAKLVLREWRAGRLKFP